MKTQGMENRLNKTLTLGFVLLSLGLIFGGILLAGVASAQAKVLASKSISVTATIPETSAEISTNCKQIRFSNLKKSGVYFAVPCLLQVNKKGAGKKQLHFHFRQALQEIQAGDPRVYFAVLPKNEPRPAKNSPQWLEASKFNGHQLSLKAPGVHRFRVHVKLHVDTIPQNREYLVRWDVTQSNQ